MKGFFIDVQGTLIDDKDFLPLPGSIKFLDFLNKNDLPYILITNNTKRPSEEFQSYLKNLGFDFKNYIDPLMVLDEILASKKIAAYGSEKFLNVLKSKGFTLDYENPESVLLGIKLYSNDEFSQIIEFLLNGAELVGMHKTSLYSHNSKRYPGLGAILEMLKYATDKDYVTVGKPSTSFFDRAKSILGLNYDKITIISDDLKGDLIPAKKLGMQTVLVLSGKIKDKKEITQKPDFVFENIKELLNYWRKNGEKITRT
ncbi:HAD-superfamily hydrolase, subfamily IIA [Nautilia profundicola AmH]|uniref:HAD-superfamily hydrolase, subfamily IIA n=1 Tax=Nautilia profundicola (strain ATCC BAA-1463 / DSM 18972 / AmH) TaxID=598659 RepID=B9LA43_NAUPA|nr:HAD-IIA family hydrolase [Nautilia profundicola]ACM92596.1 HAD-superfamily hydrolase, subfamily IIA [Nautilia profundicola AmH]